MTIWARTHLLTFQKDRQLFQLRERDHAQSFLHRRVTSRTVLLLSRFWQRDALKQARDRETSNAMESNLVLRAACWRVRWNLFCVLESVRQNSENRHAQARSRRHGSRLPVPSRILRETTQRVALTEEKGQIRPYASDSQTSPSRFVCCIRTRIQRFGSSRSASATGKCLPPDARIHRIRWAHTAYRSTLLTHGPSRRVFRNAYKSGPSAFCQF